MVDREKVIKALELCTSKIETRTQMDKLQFVYVSDMVNVCRCAGCKYWETDWIPKGTIQGFHFCPMVGFVTREDFYCANGERRDGDA